MQLICHYDREYPAVVGHVGDDVVVDLGHPSLRGCVVLPFSGDTIEAAVRKYGRAGPAPELMGDPPTECHPDHAKLDEAGVPDHVVGDDGKPRLNDDGVPIPHPLRAKAGKPYADRRRLAEDLRPPAAPPQSDAGVLRAYAGQRRWQLEVSGIVVGVKVRTVEQGEEKERFSDVPVRTDRASQDAVERLALRVARRPDGRVQFGGADDVVRDIGADEVVRIADAVAEHVDRLRDAEVRVRTAVETGEVSDFAAVDAMLGE